ncbi:hypothetical protein SAMN05892877_12179 [Rhizobium subbaraonis]|uniref:Uncharacterized protein n=1 Tax=Rhizobium subbaraonis TaxID=908946 RepID=A0A285UWN6_9HYPH|nr:hypothetical protein [Rhizobium subbaraonis]SOC46262.1 hypothetical protein SAMN05892877_12179 [Rhizobium subbaraonis]
MTKPSAIPFGGPKQIYVPAAFEPEIRNRILSGKSVAVIATELGADEARLRTYVNHRIERWRTQGRAPVRPDDGKIVVYRTVRNNTGEFVRKPIRLPYVTMHARVLEARAGR